MDVQVEYRRSGHIPAFGNWDYANDLPITQYFDSARQAGLIRFCDHSNTTTTTHTVVAPSRKKKESQVAGRRNNTYRNTSNLTATAAAAAAAAQVKEESEVVKSQEQQETQRRKKHMYAAANEKKIMNRRNSDSFKPKPEAVVVDEDLYKIPPHLLHTSKRKKMLGFLSRCLGPGCTA